MRYRVRSLLGAKQHVDSDGKIQWSEAGRGPRPFVRMGSWKCRWIGDDEVRQEQNGGALGRKSEA